jgi:hypothetical protein
MSTEADALLNWFASIKDAIGHKGNKYFSDKLNLNPSVISKLVSKKSSFDLKTIKATALLMSTKDEHFKEHPVRWKRNSGGYLVRCRVVGSEEIITWENIKKSC